MNSTIKLTNIESYPGSSQSHPSLYALWMATSRPVCCPAEFSHPQADLIQILVNFVSIALFTGRFLRCGAGFSLRLGDGEVELGLGVTFMIRRVLNG
jgi:hypothetical protein